MLKNILCQIVVILFKTMKYLQLFESWNPLSDKDLASAQELHKIGVVSDKELSELTRLKEAHQQIKKILKYPGVGNLNLSYTTRLKSLPNGLKVGGHLILTDCTDLASLPDGLEVGGFLDLSGCKGLASLPSGLKVGRDLYLYGCIGIDKLPQDQKNIKVGGQIWR